MSFLTAADYLN